MALIASDTGEGFKSVEPGSYAARCIRLIDIGTQHGEYEGVPNKRNQMILVWEFPTELIEGGDLDGRPHTISGFYTKSLGKKASLRKVLESWRGRAFTEEELKGFDLRNIIGKPCFISVIHNDKGKARISSIMGLPKGMTCPEQIEETVVFDIDAWDQKTFDGLSKGIQEIIMKSDEVKDKGYNADYEGNHEEGDPGFSDDIPF